MKKRAHTKVYKEESRLFYGALCVCIGVVCMYMYFVSISVVHVVMRKEVDNQIAEVSTRISQLEEEYIEKQQSLNTSIASAHGFIAAEEKVFIDKSKTLVLSNN